MKWHKVKNSGTNARTTQKYILRWTTWQKTTGSLPRPRRNTNSGEKFNNINISMCVKMCICLFILLQTYFQFRQLPCSAARQLCQMQRICLAATLVQGCHNEAKAFFLEQSFNCVYIHWRLFYSNFSNDWLPPSFWHEIMWCLCYQMSYSIPGVLPFGAVLI